MLDLESPTQPTSDAPSSPVFTPAADLQEAFWRLKKSRIRVSNTLTSRASSIGEPCERKLYYARTAGELAAPHDPKLQALFDLGNELETYVVHELEAMGATVVQRGRDYLDRDLELSAHSDARIQMRGWPRPITAEIKGLNPYTAEHVESIDDIRHSQQPWVRKYYDQMETYLSFDQSDRGIFVLLNKVSGQIVSIDCPRDDRRISEIRSKAARIRDAVRATEPLPRHESSDCDRCPFLSLCLPDRKFGPGVQILDNEEVESLIARKLELAAAKSEAEAIDRQLKKLLPEVPELLVGNYVVTGEQRSRKGYTVAATSYWQRDYRILKTETEGVH